MTESPSSQIDYDEVMRRVAVIAPELSEHARECDDARQVVPESMRAMVDAGFFRIPQPSRSGGYELSLRAFDDAVTRLSQACPSSGWVLMVVGVVIGVLRSITTLPLGSKVPGGSAPPAPPVK